MSWRARAERALGVVKNQGPRWVAERLVLEAQKRAGYEARIYRPRAWRGEAWVDALTPALRRVSSEGLWEIWKASEGAAWGRLRREDPAFMRALRERPSTVRARADAILAGRFTLFSWNEVDLGFPPDWLAHPVRGQDVRAPGDRHWSQVSMEGSPYGDLKFIWELSRMPWAFTLARAYALTEDERYAEGFWTLWLDWLDRNPPHATVQWKCGQECALRLIAVSFAVQVLARARASTPARFARHLEAMDAHADRIARAGWYAKLQNNNHSISEAAGLYTAGIFYPQLARAPHWRRLGWRDLQDEARRLVRDDGTFIQKSHNYHRLMMQDYLWAESVREGIADLAARDPWEGEALARLEAATTYLEGIVDPRSGAVPNFGHNDGALILPLDDAPYDDYRPVLAAARYRRDRRLPTSDPALESTLWLFGPEVLSASSGLAPPRSPTLDCETGGIYTLRQRESWAFTHAENLRDRPAQADLLHVDLWWRGQAIARDAGTYLYYGDPTAFAWFKGTRCHNTVTVDDRDQMEAGPRFLWVTRAHARAQRLTPSPEATDGGALLLAHDGYERGPAGVRHTRAVRALGDDVWIVSDELTTARDSQEHLFTLHWLLPDLSWSWLDRGSAGAPPHGLRLLTSQGAFFVEVAVLDQPNASLEVVRAAEGPSLWGWESRHYGEKTPALSLLVRTKGTRARFLTRFSPQPPTIPLGRAAWLDDDHPGL